MQQRLRHAFAAGHAVIDHGVQHEFVITHFAQTIVDSDSESLHSSWSLGDTTMLLRVPRPGISKYIGELRSYYT